MRHDALIERIDGHKVWMQTAGERGCQLDLDSFDLTAIDLCGFPFEQIYLAACRLRKLHFKDVDFFASEFYSCDFSSACFVGCSFRKATLDYCDFKGARFVRCQFPRAEVYQSTFAECRFEDCSFVGINLMESDFSKATLHGTDWEEAYLDRVLFRSAAGSGSKGLSTIIQPRISSDEGALEGEAAIEWLRAHLNQG